MLQVANTILTPHLTTERGRGTNNYTKILSNHPFHPSLLFSNNQSASKAKRFH